MFAYQKRKKPKRDIEKHIVEKMRGVITLTTPYGYDNWVYQC